MSAFDHHVDSAGEEIEIARALIQANEDVQEDGPHQEVDELQNQNSNNDNNEKNGDLKRTDDETNMFSKDNN